MYICLLGDIKQHIFKHANLLDHKFKILLKVKSKKCKMFKINIPSLKSHDHDYYQHRIYKCELNDYIQHTF